MFQGLLGRSWILVAASLLCCGTAVLAEDDKGATVSSNGGAAVKLTPTIFRVQVQVLGQGKTVAAALEKLKGRRESAVEKIKSLGANADSIVVGKPSVINARPTPPALYPAPQMGPPVVPAPESADGTPDARSPLAFLRRGKERPRSARDGTGDTAVGATSRGRVTVRADAEPGVVAAGSLLWAAAASDDGGAGWIPDAAHGGSKEGVVVSATISADWPLEADGPEALLLKAEKLKKRILDADPSGRKAAAEKAAEEDDTAPAPARPYQIAPAPLTASTPAIIPTSGCQFLLRRQGFAETAPGGDGGRIRQCQKPSCGTGHGGRDAMRPAPRPRRFRWRWRHQRRLSARLRQSTGGPDEESSPDLGASFFFRVTVTAKFRLLEK